MSISTGNKPFFTRPIEISAGLLNNIFRATLAGSVERTITLDPGVYSSIQALMSAIEDAANESALGVDDEVVVVLQLAESSDSKDVIINWSFTRESVPTQVALDVTTSAANFGPLIGAEDDTYNQAVSIDMEFRPENVWVPTYQKANQGRWWSDHADLFSGTQGKTGIVAGNTVGPAIYYRTLEFINEPAVNLFDDAATAAHLKKKNLDYFVQQSLQSYPTVTTYPSTKGFFYFDDWQNADGDDIPGGTTGTSTTSLGINFDYSSSPSLFAYCQFDPRGIRAAPRPASPSGISYYNVSFLIHTIELMPTWEDPEKDDE